MAKKQLMRTAPGMVEHTSRTRRMKRPMRCSSCGTTQHFRRIVVFDRKKGKRCTKCAGNC